MKTLMLISIAVAAASGCTCIESTDATRDPDFLITEAPTIDENYKPLGFIRAEKSGWYLLAIFPIVSVSLDELVWEIIVPEARKRGADGIINLKYQIDPACFWRFDLLGAVPLPDWGARGLITGMAIKRTGPKNPDILERSAVK